MYLTLALSTPLPLVWNLYSKSSHLVLAAQTLVRNTDVRTLLCDQDPPLRAAYRRGRSGGPTRHRGRDRRAWQNEAQLRRRRAYRSRATNCSGTSRCTVVVNIRFCCLAAAAAAQHVLSRERLALQLAISIAHARALVSIYICSPTFPLTSRVPSRA